MLFMIHRPGEPVNMKVLCILTHAALLAVLLIPHWVHATAPAEGCPVRIVSLNLASDEILIDLVDPGRIAAFTYLSDNPVISNIAPRALAVKGKLRAVLEDVVAFDPDMVILAKFSHADFAKQLTDAGIRTVYLKEFESISGIERTIETIGRAVCEEEKARALIEEMRGGLEEIAADIPPGAPRPRVMYYTPAGFTAGGNSIVGDMIEHAGGINVVKEAGLMGNQKVSLEFIIEIDPDIIFMNSYSPDKPEFSKGIMKNSLIKEVSAVRHGRVHILSDRLLIGGSHYVVHGVRELARIFYSGTTPK